MARSKRNDYDLPRGWTDMDGAMTILTLGETKVTELARGGAIEAKRHGRRIIYGIESMEAWIDALPPAYPDAVTTDEEIAA